MIMMILITVIIIIIGNKALIAVPKNLIQGAKKTEGVHIVKSKL